MTTFNEHLSIRFVAGSLKRIAAAAKRAAQSRVEFCRAAILRAVESSERQHRRGRARK